MRKWISSGWLVKVLGVGLLLCLHAQVGNALPAAIGAEERAFEVSIPPNAPDSFVIEFFSTITETTTLDMQVSAPQGVELSIEQLPYGANPMHAVQIPVLIGTVTTHGNYDTAYIRAAFVKDACAKPGVWLLRLTFDVRAMRSEERTSGFPVYLSLREALYEGSRAASLKPVSDGKFFPQPLLLMSSVARLHGGFEVIIASPPSRRRKTWEIVTIEDYVPYRGLLLTRSAIGRFFKRSRKMSFSLLSPAGSYSVCFRMKRKRQYANRYPR